jgi:hypothetical protein
MPEYPSSRFDRPLEKGAITHVGRDNVKMGALVGQAVLAAKRSVPTFIDAGTTLVTSTNVGPFDLSAFFASCRPKIFSEGK